MIARLLAAALLCLAPVLALAGPPTIDAASVTTAGGTSIASKAISLTTAAGGDILILYIDSKTSSGAAPSVSGVSGAGLTWACRVDSGGACKHPVGSGSPIGDLEEWWAYSAGALSAASITVTMNTTVDGLSIIGFGVHGAASATSPFDPNPSLMAAASGAASSTVQLSGVATTKANDLLIGAVATASGIPALQALAMCMGSVKGLDDANILEDTYALLLTGTVWTVNSAQSSLTFNLGTSCPSSSVSGTDWTLLADALTSGGNAALLNGWP